METIILAYLANKFGTTIARALLATLLHQGGTFFDAFGANDIANTVVDDLDISGMITSVTDGDRKSVRNANYLFDTIGEDAAEKLAEVFHKDGRMEEAEWQITVDAAKDTLNRHALNLLIEQGLNQHDFRKELRNTPPLHALETTDQEELYRRLLDISAQVTFALADTIPNFTRDATAKILQNETRLLADMGLVLENQERILAKSYGTIKAETDSQFESEYRTLLASELDRLELFGVDNFDGAKQPLTVAYIQLHVQIRSQGKQNVQPSYLDKLKEVITSIERKRLSVAEALNESNRMIIVSSAGSGKTTLLKWIAVQTANDNLGEELTKWRGYIPFFVRLREYIREPLPTIGTLATASRELRPLADSVSDNWSTDQFRDKQAIVLLDGMDEVSNEKRQEAVDWLDTLLKLYPETVVIVSSRPAGLTDQSLKHELDRLQFEPIELLPLQPEQVTKFVEQWHEAMEDEHCRYLDKSRVPIRKESLLNALKQREDLRKLGESPILCSMLCALNLLELGELPKDRIRLYDRCISILLRRDENREVDSSDYSETLRPDNARRRLGTLALWMMENDPSLIKRADAERLLENEGLQATGVLDFLAARSVIFREQALDEFDFIHRTFVEFLAAQEIVRIHKVGAIAKNNGTDSEWHETFRLLAGHVEPTDQSTLLKTLYDLSQSEPEHRRTLHFLAWDFWDLLDSRTGDALEAMVHHLRSLNLGGANSLNLRGIQFRDISALAQLTNLQHLSLGNILSRSQISDAFALAQLTNLQRLDLSGTSVQDISALAKLTNLQRLDLFMTPVSDVSALAHLTKLQHLNLSMTEVSDVSALAHLTSLQSLTISHIDNHRRFTASDSNVAKPELTPIPSEYLDSNNSFVKKISLGRLDQLTHLVVGGFRINNISSLAQLCRLEHLVLSETQVSNISAFAQLSHLQILDLSYTKVRDISALAKLNNLQNLNLGSTPVSDVSHLSQLTNLKQLDLSDTEVNDISYLTQLTDLEYLDLSYTLVSDISYLTQHDNLVHLDLIDTEVSDVSVLAHLTKVKLKIKPAQLSTLSGIDQFCRLELLGENTVLGDNTNRSESDPFPTLTSFKNLQYLDMSMTQFSDLSDLAQLHNLQHLDLHRTRVCDPVALIRNIKLPDVPEQALSQSDLNEFDTEINRLRDLITGEDFKIKLEANNVSNLVYLNALRYLNLSQTQFSFVSALAQLTNLQHLDLSRTQVSDVSALAQLTNLRHLDLSGTQVSDVFALKSLTSLQTLDLSGTQVSDVSALREALPDLLIHS